MYTLFLFFPDKLFNNIKKKQELIENKHSTLFKSGNIINIKNINVLISSKTLLFLKLIVNLCLHNNYLILVYTEESYNAISSLLAINEIKNIDLKS